MDWQGHLSGGHHSGSGRERWELGDELWRCWEPRIPERLLYTEHGADRLDSGMEAGVRNEEVKETPRVSRQASWLAAPLGGRK